MTVNELNKYAEPLEEKQILTHCIKNGIISADRKQELKRINKQLKKLSSVILNCRNRFIKEIMIQRFINSLTWIDIAKHFNIKEHKPNDYKRLVTEYLERLDCNGGIKNSPSSDLDLSVLD